MMWTSSKQQRRHGMIMTLAGPTTGSSTDGPVLHPFCGGREWQSLASERQTVHASTSNAALQAQYIHGLRVHRTQCRRLRTGL